MSASTFAAVHVVPLLARVVLCAAFVPAGYAKLFDRVDATPAEVARLEAIGWRWTPPPRDAGAGEAGSTAEAAGGARDLGSEPGSDHGSPGASTPRLRGCEKLALFLDAKGLPAPRMTGWLVAIIEFVGGALVLLGLFSRLWALGLAGVMVGAVSMTTLEALKAHPFIHGMDMESSLKFMVQAALFVLSFGVFLTGPGGFSLDAILFGRSGGSGRPRATRSQGGGQGP